MLFEEKKQGILTCWRCGKKWTSSVSGVSACENCPDIYDKEEGKFHRVTELSIEPVTDNEVKCKCRAKLDKPIPEWKQIIQLKEQLKDLQEKYDNLLKDWARDRAQVFQECYNSFIIVKEGKNE